MKIISCHRFLIVSSYKHFPHSESETQKFHVCALHD